MSASAHTTIGPLPDISMMDRFSPIARTMRSPVAEDPTNPTASMPGWVTSASPTAPGPGRIETRPAGTPASVNSSPRARQASGVSSGGLATTALPVASAGPTNSHMIMRGKFHGVIEAHTPTGVRKLNMRLFRSLLGMVSPYRRLASSAETENRAAVSSTSVRASASGFPCSNVVSRASSSACASIRPATRWHSSARSYVLQLR